MPTGMLRPPAMTVLCCVTGSAQPTVPRTLSHHHSLAVSPAPVQPKAPHWHGCMMVAASGGAAGGGVGEGGAGEAGPTSILSSRAFTARRTSATKVSGVVKGAAADNVSSALVPEALVTPGTPVAPLSPVGASARRASLQSSIGGPTSGPPWGSNGVGARVTAALARPPSAGALPPPPPPFLLPALPFTGVHWMPLARSREGSHGGGLCGSASATLPARDRAPLGGALASCLPPAPVAPFRLPRRLSVPRTTGASFR